MLLWSALMLSTFPIAMYLSLSVVSAEFGISETDEEAALMVEASPAELIRQAQDELYEMLNIEKLLFNTLRHFITSQEQKLAFVKR